jgi:hypothetical protein
MLSNGMGNMHPLLRCAKPDQIKPWRRAGKTWQEVADNLADTKYLGYQMAPGPICRLVFFERRIAHDRRRRLKARLRGPVGRPGLLCSSDFYPPRQILFSLLAQEFGRALAEFRIVRQPIERIPPQKIRA